MGSDRGWGPSGTASRLSVEGCWGEVEVLVVVVVGEVEVVVAVVVVDDEVQLLHHHNLDID